MITQCAWCQHVMDPGTDPNDQRVSHGMCPACDQLSDDARDLLAEQRARERTGAQRVKEECRDA